MKDRATCWTCPRFIYSGELDVGDCLLHDEMRRENDVCADHPEYEEEGRQQLENIPTGYDDDNGSRNEENT